MQWRSNDLEILAELHGGHAAQPPWRAFLGQLAQRCSADAATLVYADHATNEPVHISSAAASSERLDVEAQLRLRPLRVYAFDELGTVWVAGAAAARFGRIVKVGGTNGWSAWVLVSRNAGDFAAADSALLSTLAPQIAIAVGNFARLERERRRVAIAEDLLRRAGISWRTAHSQREFEGAAAPETEPALAKLLQHRPDTPTALRLRDDPLTDVLVVPAAPDTIVVTRAARAPSLEQIQCLARLWSLTPSEARFASALAQGNSLTEAAELLELTIETARHYSKRLYAKTGARGLPDLVRLVLTSVAALA